MFALQTLTKLTRNSATPSLRAIDFNYRFQEDDCIVSKLTASPMLRLGQQVLRLDISGMPLEWIDYRDAVRLYHTEQVAYACGSLLYRMRGGVNAATGLRSVIDVNSIIATEGNTHVLGKVRKDYTPPLNNRTLFKRDAYLCLYCGERFPASALSRDHVTPLSQGGEDTWTNVVTACRRCNNHKAGRTPEQSQMKLLAVPFTPSFAEYIYLKGRRVLADQMEYLLAHMSRRSPLRERILERVALREQPC